MSADNGPQDCDGEGASGISRREVLLTVGGVAAAVCLGAAISGGLEFFVNKQRTAGGWSERHLPPGRDGVGQLWPACWA